MLVEISRETSILEQLFICVVYSIGSCKYLLQSSQSSRFISPNPYLITATVAKLIKLMIIWEENAVRNRLLQSNLFRSQLTWIAMMCSVFYFRSDITSWSVIVRFISSYDLHVWFDKVVFFYMLQNRCIINSGFHVRLLRWNCTSDAIAFMTQGTLKA